MYYTYILKSIKYANQIYIGKTPNLRARIKKHNDGGSKHTSKYKPWKLIAYFAFEKEQTSIDFERYLKSSSGKAFMNKRLI